MDRAVAKEQPGDRGVAGDSGAPVEPAAARLALRIPAAIDLLRPLRRRVEHWARVHGLSADELADLQLALGEAVSNAMEHAYAGAGTGTVDVRLEVRATGSGREVLAKVADRGRWKPATSRPTHRGRGITMIDELSDDMRVTSNSSGTEVVFTVPLGAA
jgi:anti-sigma regulatory factor (Ser/Thr protein kinase)